MMFDQLRSTGAMSLALATTNLLCCLTLAGCSQDDSPAPTGYRTDGTAKLQVCKGAGIEVCDSEPTDVPMLIDVNDPDWFGLHSERKSATWTMCYLALPEGLFTKSKLMFDCEPIYDPLSHHTSAENREAVMQSLANLAEAAATFEICAANDDVDTESSLEWTGHSITLVSVADRLTSRNGLPEMYVAFEMRRADLVGSAEFVSGALEYTRNCDAESLREAGEYIRGTEKHKE